MSNTLWNAQASPCVCSILEDGIEIVDQVWALTVNNDINPCAPHLYRPVVSDAIPGAVQSWEFRSGVQGQGPK